MTHSAGDALYAVPRRDRQVLAATGSTHFRQSLVDRYYPTFNARDWDAWAETLDEDVDIVSDARVLHGRVAARAYANGIVQAFPGVAVVDRWVVAESPRCCRVGVPPCQPLSRVVAGSAGSALRRVAAQVAEGGSESDLVALINQVVAEFAVATARTARPDTAGTRTPLVHRCSDRMRDAVWRHCRSQFHRLVLRLTAVMTGFWNLNYSGFSD